MTTNKLSITTDNKIEFDHKKEARMGESKVFPTRENLESLMRNYNISVSYDVILKRATIIGVSSLVGEEENALIAFLKSKCAEHGLNKAVVGEQISTIMNDNAHNPVTHWLNRIERSRNHNPVHELVDALPIANKEWAKVALYRWLIQSVAAADKADSTNNSIALPKYESILVFFGKQGLGKTSFIRSLLPKELKSYLKDGIVLDLYNKDSKIEALSAWITELGELDSTLDRANVSVLKAFLSKQEDEIRKPYAKAASIMPRQTSFFASVNEVRFLRDDTGNRRYFPIIVTDNLIIPDKFDCEDLWAYIWQEYKSGNQWWLTNTEEVLQKEALKAHEDIHFEDMIQDVFDFEQPIQPTGLTGNSILDLLHIGHTRSNSTKLGLALTKLNIEKKGRLYLLPPKR